MSLEEIVQPKRYKTGQIDLIESWYRLYPWDEFVSIMESHINKYVKRHRFKNGVHDLAKAKVFLDRLVEYTDKHASSDK